MKKSVKALLILLMIAAFGMNVSVISAEGESSVTEFEDEEQENLLKYSEYTMGKHETFRLHTLSGEKVTKWSVENKKIAKIIKKGDSFVYVKALKKGTTTITALIDDETYECELTVRKMPKSVIYLTFDDGPSQYSTPKILDILKKNEVPATFFVINYDKKGEKLIKREITEGHQIAIHGYSHEYSEVYKSEKAYMQNLKKMQDKLYKTLGYRIWNTRFPGGSSNLVSRHYSKGIMSRLVKTVDDAGFAYFDWNVSSADAGGASNSSQVYRMVISGLKKNRDNIVLMHDFSGNNKTIGALESIIRYGKKHGYEFRCISDSTNQVHHGVLN